VTDTPEDSRAGEAMSWLIGTQLPFYRAVIQAWLFSAACGVGLSILAIVVLQLPPRLVQPIDSGNVLSNILISSGPSALIETWLITVVVGLLRYASSSLTIVSIITGLLGGAAHAIAVPIWFFGSAVAFFVFASMYQTWGDEGEHYWRGFMAAYLPHAINNSVMYLLLWTLG
jgi:hypothetical protein